MEFVIKNNQVFTVTHITTQKQIACVEVHFCYLFSYRLLEETETHTIYQSTKFDIELGEYVDCFEDDAQVEIEGKIYTSINGIITISKQSQ